ncbi:MAG: hypothetical protein NVSMB47_20680 [Polyangiales bacterium]
MRGMVRLPSELREGWARLLDGAEIALIHSAPRAIGLCAGGVDTVLDALLAVLGDRTVVVPTFTTGLTDPAAWHPPPLPKERWDAIRDELPCFDPETSTPRHMGRLADLLWRRPEAVRSHHPVESLAAIGPRAEALLQTHPIDDPKGPRSPWAKLVALDARVLLVGVGLERCTLLHHCERVAEVPYLPLAAYAFPFELDGARHWIEVDRAGGHCSDGFAPLRPALEAAGGLRADALGDATVLVLSARIVHDVATARLAADPTALLCRADDCPQCVPARQIMGLPATAPGRDVDEPSTRR